MCTSFTITSSQGDIVYGRTMEFTLQLHSKVIVFPRGVTLTGTMTMATNTVRQFIVTVTSSTALTIQSTAVGTIS